MAPTAVNVAEYLRPWLGAGVYHLLADDEQLVARMQEAAAEELRNVPAARPACAALQAVPPGAARQPVGHTAPVAPHREQSRPPEFTAGKYPSGPPQRTSHVTAPAPQPQVARTEVPHKKPAPPAAPVLEPETWPEVWQAMWQKTAPAPIIWTYWSLGEDLGATPSNERRELLRSIIGQLTLPRGSSAFWPVAVADPQQAADDEGSTLTAAPQIFLSGVERLNPRYIIVFGSKGLRSFAPESGLGPYMFTQYRNRRLIALPDIDHMLTDRKHVAAIVAYLRTAITLR